VSERADDNDKPTPFALLGGQETVDRLVDAFYDNMDTLPEAAAIRAMHGTDLRPIRQVFKHYFAEWLGGPPDYTTRRGHPRLRARHLPFTIGVAERDAWMACMRAALEQTIADVAVREELIQVLGRVADHMRNRPEA